MTTSRRIALAFLCFLPMAAIGTVSHELGHVAAYHALGGSAVLHFASAEPVGVPGSLLSIAISIAGGPLQTMITGTIGLICLWWLPREGLDYRKWIAMLLALFWSRETFNLLSGLLTYFSTGSAPWMGDEYRLAYMLGWGSWSVQLPLGLLGLAACALAIWRIPKEWRIPVVAGGVPGSLVGFWIWMSLLGPMLLP